MALSPPRRRFSPLCVSCNEPIVPAPGSEETVRVVALDKNFHLKCYRCEVRHLTFLVIHSCRRKPNLENFLFFVSIPGLRSPSLHWSRWKWLLSTGRQDSVYEVPHQESRASRKVICITLFTYEPNPKAQDLLSCRFAFASGLLFCNRVYVWALQKKYVCMQIL